MAGLPDTEFWRVYDGPMKGVLDWERYKAFMDLLGASDGEWFVFDLHGDVPDTPVSGAKFAAALARADTLVRAVRNRPWLGAVYADDLNAPSYVKIFDPALLGGSCSMPGSRMRPRWIISRIRPDPLSVPSGSDDMPAGLVARLTRKLSKGQI